MKNNKGFTLVELLVVFSIISVLIALTVIGLELGQQNQRDTTRKDLGAQISTQLVAYQQVKHTFPATPAAFLGSGSFIDTSNAQGCSASQIDIDQTCISLNGMALDTNVYTGASCPPRPNPFSYNQLSFCYIPSGGTIGYQLGVYLESSSNAYMVAN